MPPEEKRTFNPHYMKPLETDNKAEKLKKTRWINVHLEPVPTGGGLLFALRETLNNLTV